MPAPIIIPFDNNPVDFQLTNSYTIPAGRFARIKANSPACTVDGSYVWSSGSPVTFSINNAGTLLSIPTRYTGRVQTNATTGAKNLGCIGENLAADTNVSGNVTDSQTTVDRFFINGYPIGFASANVGYGLISMVYNFYYTQATAAVTSWTFTPMENPGEIWVPSGTVLAGGNFIVSEYNELT